MQDERLQKGFVSSQFLSQETTDPHVKNVSIVRVHGVVREPFGSCVDSQELKSFHCTCSRMEVICEPYYMELLLLQYKLLDHSSCLKIGTDILRFVLCGQDVRRQARVSIQFLSRETNAHVKNASIERPRGVLHLPLGSCFLSQEPDACRRVMRKPKYVLKLGLERFQPEDGARLSS